MKYKDGDFIKVVSEDKMKELTPGMFKVRNNVLPIPESVIKMEEEQLEIIKKISGKEFEIKSTDTGRYYIGDGKSIFLIEEELIEGYAEEQIIPEYGEWYNVKDLESPVKCCCVNRYNFLGKMNNSEDVLTVGYSNIKNKITDPEVLQGLSIGEAKKGVREILFKDIPDSPLFTTTVKPPLVLKPLKLWEEGKDNERTLDILQAMLRYSQDEKPVPGEWVKELTGRVINLMGGIE